MFKQVQNTSPEDNTQSSHTPSLTTSLFQAFVLPSALCAAGVLFFWSLPANSQTLNCAHAKSPAEFTVCNDEILQTMDEDLWTLYRHNYKKQPTKPQQQVMSKAQSLWRVRRTKCGTDTQCLNTLYKTRIEDLATSGSNLTAYSGN